VPRYQLLRRSEPPQFSPGRIYRRLAFAASGYPDRHPHPLCHPGLYHGSLLRDADYHAYPVPLVTNLGYDPIWFGVITVIMLEMGLITPPVGMNVFVIAGMARDVPMYTIFKGIWPFVFAMVVCIALLIVFPQIALFLPKHM